MKYFCMIVCLLFFTVTVIAQKSEVGFYLDKSLQYKNPVGYEDCTPEVVVSYNCWGKPATPVTSPLIVINNKPATYEEMKALDSNKIESVDLLKADKATLLYGKRGANGAICITTKRIAGDVFQVSDEEGNKGVNGATVTFVNQDNDSLHFITDNNGLLQTDALQEGVEYRVIVTSIGYKDFFTGYHTSKSTSPTKFQLKRNIKLNPEVVVIAYGRRVARSMVCGGVFMMYKPMKKISGISSDIASKMYPNPVNKGGGFKVEFETANPQSLQVKVYTLNGAQLSNISFVSMHGLNRIEIPVPSHWAAGVYIVRAIDEKGDLLLQNKIIVQ